MNADLKIVLIIWNVRGLSVKNFTLDSYPKKNYIW